VVVLTRRQAGLGTTRRGLDPILKRMKKKIILLVAGLLLIVPLSEGATLSNVLSEARTLARTELAPGAPGLSIAVAHDGKIIWSEGFGFADVAAKRPVTAQTLFRIGSVSKPITAAGLMLLVEKGAVDLDADIHRYVPDFPDKGQVITTRQLAGHLGGIRHYRGREILLDRHYTSVREGLTIFENDKLVFVPGENFFYSSYGYNLISAVMEGAAKTNFLSYMSNNVFAPLGLTNTMADDVTRELPQRTCFYQVKKTGGFEIAPPVDNSYKWASGGFLSTPEDLVRFGSAHLRPGFLTQASLDALFTSQKTREGVTTGYGIGWGIWKDKAGHRILSHSGGSVGGTSLLVIQPESRVVLAITANCTDAPSDKTNFVPIVEGFAGLFEVK
jgi:serine beta-lactamase-like protein LACTB